MAWTITVHLKGKDIMRQVLAASALALGLCTATNAYAVTVDSTATIYPGNPGGSTPGVVIDLNGATSLTFSVTGSILFNNGTGNNSTGADGVGAASSSNISGQGGISGISLPYASALVGVFESTTTPADPAHSSATTSYDAAALMNASYSPALYDAFFIGDGLTGNNGLGQSDGTTQTFFVPLGATTLVLGFADAGGYSGAPGSYGDNLGSLDVTVDGIGGAVPEPATWAMMLGGFGLVGGAMRRRQRTAVRFG